MHVMKQVQFNDTSLMAIVKSVFPYFHSIYIVLVPFYFANPPSSFVAFPGKPIFPIVLGGLTVHSLGEVSSTHSETRKVLFL